MCWLLSNQILLLLPPMVSNSPSYLSTMAKGKTWAAAEEDECLCYTCLHAIEDLSLALARKWTPFVVPL